MSTAYLLAHVDCATGQITSYGIYGERTPTTKLSHTWFEVHAATDHSYAEARQTLLKIVDTYANQAPYARLTGPLYKRIQQDVGKPK